MREPRVRRAAVRALLLSRLRLDVEGIGESVVVLAEHSGVSPRTIYRVLAPGGERATIALELADRLLIAVGEHLSALPHDAMLD